MCESNEFILKVYLKFMTFFFVNINVFLTGTGELGKIARFNLEIKR